MIEPDPPARVGRRRHHGVALAVVAMLGASAWLWTHEAPPGGAPPVGLERHAWYWELLSEIGHGEVIVFCLLCGALASRRPWRFGVALAAVAAAATVTGLLKVSVGRPRPDGSPFSWPSGHSTAVFAAAAALFASAPALRTVLWLPLAVVLAAARAVTGWHYPADVLAGAAIGAGAGWTIGHGPGRRLARLRAPCAWRALLAVALLGYWLLRPRVPQLDHFLQLLAGPLLAVAALLALVRAPDDGVARA